MGLVVRGVVLSIQEFEGGNKRVIVASTGRYNDQLMLGPDVPAEVGEIVEVPVRAAIDRNPETGATSVMFWGLGWVRKARTTAGAGAHV